jgi:hypothetical protein
LCTATCQRRQRLQPQRGKNALTVIEQVVILQFGLEHKPEHQNCSKNAAEWPAFKTRRSSYANGLYSSERGLSPGEDFFRGRHVRAACHGWLSSIEAAEGIHQFQPHHAASSQVMPGSARRMEPIAGSGFLHYRLV